MRSRCITLLTVFCALWFVLPSCITFAVWQNAERGGHTNRTDAEPTWAWFAADDTDTLVIALPPDVVEQISRETDLLPKDAVGLLLTSPGLRARLRASGTSSLPLNVRILRDAEGGLTITSTDGLWPFPELQGLDALPPLGEPLAREIRLQLACVTAADGMVWLRVLVTPVTVVLDLVTLPVQVVGYFIFLANHF